MRRRDIAERAGDATGSAPFRRRRMVVAGTLLAGTAGLAGTLAAPSGSPLFYGLGLWSGVVWIVGAVLSGPIPLGVGADPTDSRRRIVLGLLAGVGLYAAFAAGTPIAARVPALSGSLKSILDGADAGWWPLVLGVALVNGVGEELFFRGAVPGAIGQNHPALWSTAVYGMVTIATLNLALVAAALVMGGVFSLQRRATGGVLVPTVTHLTWSTLMLLLLPRPL